jgi:phosphatidylglycerol---prolipoprotein diacylglyceryl transferase
LLPHIHIFGITIQTFGIMFGLAFVAAGALLARRLRELDRPADWSYEIIFAALVGGLVGARVYYIVQNYSLVKHDLLGSLFSGSGLVWYGGAIGGAIGVGLWAWRRRLNALTLLDLCAPGLALGYAIGRIGCQLSGDGDYGKVSHLPWAMGYPHGTVPTPPGVRVHPTPVYETLAMGIVTLVLWRLRDRYRPGVVFALYLVLSGLERLLVEFIRRNHHVVAGLTAPQLESVVAIVVGLAAIACVSRRGGIRRPLPAAEPAAKVAV